MNFRQLSIASVLLFTLGSCDSAQAQCNPVTTAAPAVEISTLKEYISSAGIKKAVADKRGFYYKIDKAGSGAKPTACSTVTVNYAGKLTNGTQFDANNGIEFPLAQLIVGWQEGIPLIAPGGKITLYLPPSLAYGSNAQGAIPANSILVFTIDLISVK